jgi:mannose/fructose/N-acetylgalactosamine-specific phosphotransferase system component IID
MEKSLYKLQRIKEEVEACRKSKFFLYCILPLLLTLYSFVNQKKERQLLTWTMYFKSWKTAMTATTGLIITMNIKDHNPS